MALPDRVRPVADVVPTEGWSRKTLQRASHFVHRWIWLWLVGVVLSAGICYVVSIRQPRVYEAGATLLVIPGQSPSGATDYGLVLAAQQLTRTYAQLVKTRPVLEKAIQDGNLDLTVEQAASMIDVSAGSDSRLIQVRSRAGNPELAAALSNLAATALAQQTEANQAIRLNDTEAGLRQQLDQLAADNYARISQFEALRATSGTEGQDPALLTRLQLEVTQLQQNYGRVSRSEQELRLAQARTSDVLTLAEPAIAPPTPVQPRVMLNVVVAAVVGLLGMTGVAGLVEVGDDRLISSERLTAHTGLHTLGIVELRLKGPLVTLDESATRTPTTGDGTTASQFSEAFRILSTNLHFAAVDVSLRSLLVTSSGPGEGKTTIAANLAMVVAQSGKRVVLVDGDLRRPRLHHVFQVPNRTGLTSLLVDEQVPTGGELVATQVAGLALLPSGPSPANPSELLASQRLRRRLAEISSNADLVIIDSPPVLAFSDAVLLGGVVDAVLLVTNGTRTRGQAAREATATLRRGGARILGGVLNAVPRDHRSRESTRLPTNYLASLPKIGP